MNNKLYVANFLDECLEHNYFIFVASDCKDYNDKLDAFLSCWSLSSDYVLNPEDIEGVYEIRETQDKNCDYYKINLSKK
jgi:hypothetical protein